MQGFISVSELNEYIATLLKTDEFLTDFWIKGEISGYRNYRQSGHRYFTLKDRDGAVSCVMFKTRGRGLKFEPEDGMEVLIRAYVSVYPKQGVYQVYVQEMQPYGMGGLFLYLKQLRNKLEAEGYFASEIKKPVPEMLNCVGIVTSQDGAALRDILRVIRQRHRSCRVILVHSSVQGEDAPRELAEGIRLLNEQGQAEVIIVGRGGGSFEDLMAFNTEEVVQAIFESNIPVISAVGHEVDFSLADMAADLRAATPTQAAGMAVPDTSQLARQVEKYQQRLKRLMEQKIGNYGETLDRLMMSRIWKEPHLIVERQEKAITDLQEQMNRHIVNLIQERQHRFALAVDALDKLSPLKVLQRGYTVAYREGEILRQAGDLAIGEKLELVFSDGKVQAEVSGKEMS